MNKTFSLFCFSAIIILLAWIAKMHFVFGGDYLFRFGTIGVLISFMVQIILIYRDSEIKMHNLTKLFIINSICLSIAFLGMMMKVSHIMDTQHEKDFVLDFIGYPLITISIILSFSQVDKLISCSRNIKVIFYKHIIMPWILFLFSFLLYAVYSVILVRI